MNKLIIIYRHHFTKKEFEKLNLDIYLERNISIEIWVMNKFLKDRVIFSNMKGKKKLKIKNILSLSELEKNILAQPKNNIIYQIHLKFEFQSIKIFKLITKYECKYSISPGLSYYPEKDIKQTFKNLIEKIFSLNFFYIFKVLKNKIQSFYKHVILKANINLFEFKKADFFYCRAKKYYDHNRNHFLISKNTKIIWGHQKDYEFFIKNKKNKVNKSNKKILFLDQNVPYHSDLIALGVADINPKNYYSSINSFLINISSKLKIKAHVCCHPRANIKKIKKYFPNLSLSQNDTLEQIKNAKCLIVHDSTALNFGVLYHKPIIYIYNNSLLKSKWPHVRETRIASNKLKKKIYNIDDDQKLFFKNFEKEIKVNSRNYWIYLKNYIKYKGSDKNSAEETINKLKSYKIWK